MSRSLTLSHVPNPNHSVNQLRQKNQALLPLLRFYNSSTLLQLLYRHNLHVIGAVYFCLNVGLVDSSTLLGALYKTPQSTLLQQSKHIFSGKSNLSRYEFSKGGIVGSLRRSSRTQSNRWFVKLQTRFTQHPASHIWFRKSFMNQPTFESLPFLYPTSGGSVNINDYSNLRFYTKSRRRKTSRAKSRPLRFPYLARPSKLKKALRYSMGLFSRLRVELLVKHMTRYLSKNPLWVVHRKIHRKSRPSVFNKTRKRRYLRRAYRDYLFWRSSKKDTKFFQPRPAQYSFFSILSQAKYVEKGFYKKFSLSLKFNAAPWSGFSATQGLSLDARIPQLGSSKKFFVQKDLEADSSVCPPAEVHNFNPLWLASNRTFHGSEGLVYRRRRKTWRFRTRRTSSFTARVARVRGIATLRPHLDMLNLFTPFYHNIKRLPKILPTRTIFLNLKPLFHMYLLSYKRSEPRYQAKILTKLTKTVTALRTLNLTLTSNLTRQFSNLVRNWVRESRLTRRSGRAAIRLISAAAGIEQRRSTQNLRLIQRAGSDLLQPRPLVSSTFGAIWNSIRTTSSRRRRSKQVRVGKLNLLTSLRLSRHSVTINRPTLLISLKRKLRLVPSNFLRNPVLVSLQNTEPTSLTSTVSRVPKVRIKRFRKKRLLKMRHTARRLLRTIPLFSRLYRWSHSQIRSKSTSVRGLKSSCTSALNKVSFEKPNFLLSTAYRTPTFKSRRISAKYSPNYSHSFQRNPFFLIQFLSLIKSLPMVRLRARQKFFYFAPFDFVDYKRLKKAVFNRLLVQRRRLNHLLSLRFYKWNRTLKDDTQLLNYSSAGSPHKYSLLAAENMGLLWHPKSDCDVPFGWMRFFDRSFQGGPHETYRYIRKTRFKPGYPRIWRTERKILKEYLKLTHRYQYRLTTKLQMMYYPTRQSHIHYKRIELKLDHSLILIHFAFDQFSAEHLLNNENVYLNGNVVTNGRIHVYMNDFIQLIISLRFYAVHRWLKLAAKLRFNAWLRRYYKTYRIKRRMFKDFTFRVLPDSVMNLQNSWYDIPRHFEVDYFTLSCFILTTNHRADLSHSYPIEFARLYVINMYNWKYLT